VIWPGAGVPGTTARALPACARGTASAPSAKSKDNMRRDRVDVHSCPRSTCRPAPPTASQTTRRSRRSLDRRLSLSPSPRKPGQRLLLKTLALHRRVTTPLSGDAQSDGEGQPRRAPPLLRPPHAMAIRILNPRALPDAPRAGADGACACDDATARRRAARGSWAGNGFPCRSSTDRAASVRVRTMVPRA
jgi:hypothetical protein